MWLSGGRSGGQGALARAAAWLAGGSPEDFGCCAAADCGGEPSRAQAGGRDADWEALQDEPILTPSFNILHFKRDSGGQHGIPASPGAGLPGSAMVAPFRAPRRGLPTDAAEQPGYGVQAALAADLQRHTSRNAGSAKPAGLFPATDGEAAASQEAVALRELMRRFVHDMLRGRQILVAVEGGVTELCRLSLAPNLHYLQLTLRGAAHDIPMKTVKDICPGELTADIAAPVAVDRLCTTLVLQNNECVTFRFETLLERDEFTKCVQVISMALD